MERKKPKIIQEVGFDFSWDEQKVWRLDLPTEFMNIDELTWHLDVPFLWSQPDGYYDVLPRQVLEKPEEYPDERVRTKDANTQYPIDVMRWRDRWVILDGLHRLMKRYQEGAEAVQVRKVSTEFIDIIKK